MGRDRERVSRSTQGTARAGGRVGNRFGNRQSGTGSALFGLCAGLGAALDAVTFAGDALLVSRTSDGGAIVLTLMAGDEREKAYVHSQVELDDVLGTLRCAYLPVSEATGQGRDAP